MPPLAMCRCGCVLMTLAVLFLTHEHEIIIVLSLMEYIEIWPLSFPGSICRIDLVDSNNCDDTVGIRENNQCRLDIQYSILS